MKVETAGIAYFARCNTDRMAKLAVPTRKLSCERTDGKLPHATFQLDPYILSPMQGKSAENTILTKSVSSVLPYASSSQIRDKFGRKEWTHGA